MYRVGGNIFQVRPFRYFIRIRLLVYFFYCRHELSLLSSICYVSIFPNPLYLGLVETLCCDLGLHSCNEFQWYLLRRIRLFYKLYDYPLFQLGSSVKYLLLRLIHSLNLHIKMYMRKTFFESFLTVVFKKD